VGSSHAAAGTSITSFGTGCGSTPIYLTPPPWYTGETYVSHQDFSTNTPNPNKVTYTVNKDYRVPNGISYPPQQLPFIGE
jgi:hypothetical protein